MKNIVQLESSLGHFLALKKKIRPGIRDWDTKMIQVWISQVGFEACKNIILYGKVTGAQLASA